MDNRDIDTFLDRVTDSDDYRERISEALEGVEDRAAATVELAKKAGYEFTAEELEQALTRRYGGRELDDSELEAVAGGLVPPSSGGGMCLSFPDVCKTPGPPAPFVPVPMPNIPTASRSKGGSGKVKIGKKGDKVTRSG
jgi:predicted ribosomally synthesized peptide with nif11-like leader